MVVCQLPKLKTGVRFPSLAPVNATAEDGQAESASSTCPVDKGAARVMRGSGIPLRLWQAGIPVPAP